MKLRVAAQFEASAMVGRGRATREIAVTQLRPSARLPLAEHLHLPCKLGVGNRAELGAYALAHKAHAAHKMV